MKYLDKYNILNIKILLAGIPNDGIFTVMLQRLQYFYCSIIIFDKARVGPFLICLAKEMQHIIFYGHVHACNLATLMRKERHCLVVSKAVCLWRADHSFDRKVFSFLIEIS